MDATSDGWLERADGLVTVEWKGNTVALAFFFDNKDSTASMAALLADPELAEPVIELLEEAARGYRDAHWEAVFPLSDDGGDTESKNGRSPAKADDIPF